MRQRLRCSVAERGRWSRLSFQRGIARVCRRNPDFTFRANLYLPGLADRVERPCRPWMESYDQRTRERRPHPKWQSLVRCSSSAGCPWNAIASDVHFLVGLSASRGTLACTLGRTRSLGDEPPRAAEGPTATSCSVAARRWRGRSPPTSGSASTRRGPAHSMGVPSRSQTLPPELRKGFSLSVRLNGPYRALSLTKRLFLRDTFLITNCP